MRLPTPQEYNEAIQNPRLAFHDSDLSRARPRTNRLGIPQPVTGNFASVYQLTDGRRAWAVRCFWRAFGDTQHRYDALARYLETAQPPWAVPFDFLPSGIRVGADMHPVLKMEWISGQLLHQYIAAHLNAPDCLRNLRRRWVVLAEDLERRRIAHGDLQHGNVLVVDGAIRLVDYDGMCVPPLVGLASHETGHPNYQHPARGAGNLDLKIDRFSLWVIHLSLLALEIEPTLWNEFDGGDECLILRKRDFDEPDRSRLLGMMLEHRDAYLREAARRFVDILHTCPGDVPPLSEESGPRRRFRAGWKRRPPLRVESGPLLPEWVADMIGAQPQDGVRDTPRVLSMRDKAIRLPVVLRSCAVNMTGARRPEVQPAGGSIEPDVDSVIGGGDARLRAIQLAVRQDVEPLLVLLAENDRDRRIAETDVLEALRARQVFECLRTAPPYTGPLSFVQRCVLRALFISTAADARGPKLWCVGRLAPILAVNLISSQERVRRQAVGSAVTALPEDLRKSVDAPFDRFQVRQEQRLASYMHDALLVRRAITEQRGGYPHAAAQRPYPPP